ncbi:hypothetical protein [Stenotrophomonas mori]|uniref:Solute-binding protein family 3/N-terminal domain-containing protein n=1 Tax=Stenotrophomonas mori TaxID=2871096 RepID=A0ABT0SKE0_9GAMM|nr:hypothetical protein [Stenotrophomonas mori]MCL7715799.1 hypothetical protein [Stenotrophomonas mori]
MKDTPRLRPFGIVASEQATSIAVARFDLTPFISAGIPFPVMHRSAHSLRVIADTTGLSVSPLLDDSGEDAVRVHGYFNNRRELKIDAVWVKASSAKYRTALAQRNLTGGLIDQRLPSGLHADHIVNRASLRALLAAGHAPWLMLFEVPAAANSGFGALVERHLPPFDETTPQIHLGPEHIFKLYATDWPRNRNEFEKALKDIADQVHNPRIVADIRTRFAPLFR